MDWKECKHLIKADYFQLMSNTKYTTVQLINGMIIKIITNASFKITFWFRLGSYLRTKKNPLWKPFCFIVAVIYKHNQFKTGIQLPLGTKVGGGIVFPHYGCQIIHYASSLGENVQIFQGVTIGSMRGRGGAPKIGSNVILFSGARVIGDITIGDNCVIGAGAVVTKDVPSGCVAAGVPAKVISQKGEDITKRYIV